MKKMFKERILFSLSLLFLVISFVIIHMGKLHILPDIAAASIQTWIPPGGQTAVSGQVADRKVMSDYQILYLKNSSLTYQKRSVKNPEIIIYDNTKMEVLIGNSIEAKGEISYFDEERNPGNFNRKFYYKKQKIEGSMQAEEIRIINKRENHLKEKLLEFREAWKAFLIKTAGEEKGGILCAMLLGDKTEMESEIKELYQRNGIAHVLAISGLHISLIGIFFYRLMRRITGSYIAGGAAGMIFMGLYILMIGMSISAMRAVIMFLFRVGADMSGRVCDMRTSIAVSAVCVILWRPLSYYDGGFQLSFGAVLGIFFLTIICGQKKEEKRKGIWCTLAQGLRASFAIQLATFPILLYHFFEFPIYACILNLVVVPLMSVLMLMAILGSVVGLVWMGGGLFLIRVCRWILCLFEALCQIAEMLPGYRIITGRPGLLWIFFYYLCLFAFVYLTVREGSRIGILLPVAGFLMLLIHCPFIRQPVLEITMLDVGQGDCTFLREKGGLTCLVDGGSSDVKDVGRYRIEPFLKVRGVNRLDYIFVSHGDADHMNGIQELLERHRQGIQIGVLVLPVEETWDEALCNLAKTAESEGVPVCVLEPGNQLKIKKLSLTGLFPGRNTDAEKGNASSMVLSVSYDALDMLFTGDLEGTGEEEVRNILTDQYEILKVAHHGSRNSTCAEFLDQVRPKAALISAGEDNPYGHPHAETVERLAKSGCRIYNTADGGAVILRMEGKTVAKLKIFQYNKGYENFE